MELAKIKKEHDKFSYPYTMSETKQEAAIENKENVKIVEEQTKNVKSLKEMFEKQAKERVALKSKYETAAERKQRLV